ncbi:hypothetical protein [Nocardioides sp.]|uniref:hypothetical protein n=1 Tax=Nocardioides sp. TaxID=35761 RepID=UPI002B2647B4|nr:hypothetical protein [Nocardioides sp.]
MTWNSLHTRGETLRAVIETANTRLDARLPMDVDGVAETFGDELDLVGALQLKWHTRLSGHIERQLQTEPMDLERAVQAAWIAAADELPGVRALLDHYRANPLDDEMGWALARAAVKERVLMATMAGRSGIGDLAGAPVGARIEEAARATRAARPVPTMHTLARTRPSFLARLRSVLAA